MTDKQIMQVMREDVRKAYDRINELEDAMSANLMVFEALTIKLLQQYGVPGEHGPMQIILPKLDVLKLCGAYEVRCSEMKDGNVALYALQKLANKPTTSNVIDFYTGGKGEENP